MDYVTSVVMMLRRGDLAAEDQQWENDFSVHTSTLADPSEFFKRGLFFFRIFKSLTDNILCQFPKTATKMSPWQNVFFARPSPKIINGVGRPSRPPNSRNRLDPFNSGGFIEPALPRLLAYVHIHVHLHELPLSPNNYFFLKLNCAV